ncbi:MAG: diguanylate cyclase [Candidatus Dormibacteria bacterium]|nr:diguanylate cyclase response regulator [Chloroflexota bacterium]HBV95052.1 diguanylate cyclase response regulator [Chloroflexota bacterium]
MNGTILVADDSMVVRAVLRRQLEADGHTVIEAVDGEEAITACREYCPDVVLLDVEMPVLDGHATLERLKADPDLKDIPVVFLTGRVDTADVVTGLRLGAHDYLRKPFEANELMARVSAALRTKELQDELRRRNAELDRVSRIDMLTNIYNRRHLDEHLRRAISGARRHGRTVGVLLVDIDHFKDVNDQYGHLAGDAVLKEVAARLQGAMRTEDALGRWGGEEFIAVLTDTPGESIGVLAERMRQAIASTPFVLADGTRIRVTVSIGHTAGTEDAEVLVHRSDDALYVAKEAGRNQVAAA